MSLRAVGEGHLSSIGFRTGVIDAGGEVHFDEPGARLVGRTAPGHRTTSGELFRRRAGRRSATTATSAAFVLDSLPDPFTPATSSSRRLARSAATSSSPAAAPRETDRPHPRGSRPSQLRRRLSRATRRIAERVLFPPAPTESHGMEDARFVRFVDDDGTVTYYAHLHRLRRRRRSPRSCSRPTTSGTFTHHAADRAGGQNKGMALFPRRIGGRYVALSRCDRETNAIASSDDRRCWADADRRCNARPSRGSSSSSATAARRSRRGRAGSCSPTASARCAATRIGAAPARPRRPARVIGQLREPLLAPERDERDGYVPNVVYSCGAARPRRHHRDPVRIGDANVGIALIDLPGLLHRLRGNAVARPLDDTVSQVVG